MTTYLANSGSSITTMGVLAAATNGTKIARIDIANSTTATTAFVSVYTGASFSGGTASTPFPMRAGAPTASATAKYGATVSGTQKLLGAVPLSASGAGSFQPAFDLILAPGNALWVSIGVAVIGVTIYFEELRLAWSN